MDRRTFLKTAGAAGAGIGLAALGGSRLPAAEMAHGAPHAEKLGWKLGCQAWSFKEFTFFEAIDKTASLGLHYIETGPFQIVSKDRPNEKFTEDSPAEVRAAIKKKLADCGVQLLSWGVIPLYKDVGKSRKAFDFAKEMGIETLVSEPDEQGAFEPLDRLCEEYGMKLAVHNHPQPSHYWNPETVLKACEGRSKRIGACADTGHWMRSGLNPVECLKKLDGRIIEFHFKDINKAEHAAYDVPWGTGVCDVKAMLAEIYRQKFQGLFFIEYEHNWKTSLPEIAQCVKYFDKVAAELAAGDSGVPGTRPRGLRGKIRRS
jgi:sugar phosphate isomerase/epimerase